MEPKVQKMGPQIGENDHKYNAADYQMINQMGRCGHHFYGQTLIKIGIIDPKKRLDQNGAFQNKNRYY